MELLLNIVHHGVSSATLVSSKLASSYRSVPHHSYYLSALERQSMVSHVTI